MTREQRIRNLEIKVEGLAIIAQPFIEALDVARHELRKAQRSFENGEKVHVVKLCQRGCCVEDEFTGKVTAMNSNGTYNIVLNDGSERTYVYDGSMERV